MIQLRNPTLAEIRDWPIDRILELTPRRRCVAVKLVPFNDPIFTEHFPERPIYPGSLLLNSAFATGRRMMADEPRTWRVIGVGRVRFVRVCPPGEVLTIVTMSEDQEGGLMPVRFSITGQYSGGVLTNGTFTLQEVP